MTDTSDPREDILSRILGILEALAESLAAGTDGDYAGAKAYRNRIEIPESVRPAFLLFDGDESVLDSQNRPKDSRATQVVTMTPEVYVLMADRGEGDPVGAGVNALRRAVIKAVLQDDELADLAVDGAVRYDGCVTGLAAGRSLEGEAAINFTVAYALRVSRL